MSALRRSKSFLWVAAATLIAAAACNRSAPRPPFDIHLVESTADPYVEVVGADAATLKAVRGLSPSAQEWTNVLRVSVAASNGTRTPIAGKYTVATDSIRFTPMFPFDPGRAYLAVYCGSDQAAGDRPRCTEKAVTLAARAPAAPTRVTHIFPTTDEWPENELRFYIHFSAPMGRRGGLEHVKLLDDRGREVEDPFLPLDAEFWNADRTRYTVFFDPGRQKRGILPNREMGPSLVKGRTYTLVVDRAWIDGQGSPLAETFTRRFRVGPPDLAPLDAKRWTIAPPGAGTRDGLTVMFAEPLDHGLLLRAVGVRRDGQPVIGEVRIDDAEKRWTLIPEQNWQPGRYELIALSVLEDLAGNRIGRAFEVDNFERVDKVAEPEVTAIPFALAR